MRVLIRPTFSDWCNNRLFLSGTSFDGLYRDAFSLWRETALDSGFTIDTWDVSPIEEADILWFLDLPSTRREFEQILKQLNPSCRLVLQHLESPIFSWHPLNPRNIKDFDVFLTYSRLLNHNVKPKVFHYCLPNTFRKPDINPPFKERKGMVVLNSNIVDGFWAIRQRGLSGIPLFGKFLSGWSVNPLTIIKRLTGELYSARRKLLRDAEAYMPEFIDIYGPGWQGEKISWFTGYPNRPYICSRGKSDLPKCSLLSNYRFALAYENIIGDYGYISEKIFDCFFSGTVPVYLGDSDVDKIIDPAAFVDARKFKNNHDLLSYLKKCPENEWKAFREAGQKYVQENRLLSYSNTAFVTSMMNVLNELTKYNNSLR